MPATVNNIARTASPSSYETISFHLVIEDHLAYLRSHKATRVVAITPHQLEVYQFDWRGLCRVANVPAHLVWVVIRMNEGRSFTDVPLGLRQLLIPDATVVEQLHNTHISQKRLVA